MRFDVTILSRAYALSGAFTVCAAPPAEPAGLAVSIDTAGRVTGGGWVAMADGRGSFGFNATSTGAKVKGNLVFIERTTYQGEKAILIVKSNAIDALRTSGSTFPITAMLSGKSTYKYISAANGSTLAESGNAPSRPRSSTPTPRAEPATPSPSGSSTGRAPCSSTSGPPPLVGGNIVAHLKR